jgi:hypothetical protein
MRLGCGQTWRNLPQGLATTCHIDAAAWHPSSSSLRFFAATLLLGLAGREETRETATSTELSSMGMTRFSSWSPPRLFAACGRACFEASMCYPSWFRFGVLTRALSQARAPSNLLQIEE